MPSFSFTLPETQLFSFSFVVDIYLFEDPGNQWEPRFRSNVLLLNLSDHWETSGPSNVVGQMHAATEIHTIVVLCHIKFMERHVEHKLPLAAISKFRA